MKADPFRQQRLLDLQAIDTRLAQIRHARTRLPQLAQLGAVQAEAEGVHNRLVLAETALSDASGELSRAEAEVAQVRARADRDRARLDAGSGSARELTALQEELTALTRRQTTLEDVELEAMERAQGFEAEVAGLRAQRDEVAGRVAELESARDAALAELDTEAQEVAARRPAAVEAVGAELAAYYEQVRDANGGLGAALLRARRCEGCQLELNASELARIAATPAEHVVRCEECDRILVRTPESGLPA